MGSVDMGLFVLAGDNEGARKMAIRASKYMESEESILYLILT